jgi:hypothetical protein
MSDHRRRRRRQLATGLPILAAALALCGCGYTFGSGLPEQGVRTVFVRVAGNATYRQRLEADLTLAVSRELAVSTDLLPGDRQTADAVLEVVLADEREQSLVSGSRDAPVLEGAQQAMVRIRLLRQRDGQVVLERNIVDRAEFRDPIGENLTTARSELVADLARKIGLALAAGF